MHAVHVPDNGGDIDRVSVRVRSVQERVPQAEEHRGSLRSQYQWESLWKALLGFPSSFSLILLLPVCNLRWF